MPPLLSIGKFGMLMPQFALRFSSDVSKVRCITLACYSKKELDPFASQDGLAREQWFENVKPVPWANLPRNLWALINDEFTAVFPPFMVPSFPFACPSIFVPMLTGWGPVP